MANVFSNSSPVDPVQTITQLSGIDCQRLLGPDNDHINPIHAFNHFKCLNPSNAVCVETGHHHIGLQLITYVVRGMIWSENKLLTDGMVQYNRYGLESHNSAYSAEPTVPAEFFTVWFWSSTSSFQNTISTEWTTEDIPVIREEDNSAELRILSGCLSGFEGPVLTEPDVCVCDLFLRRTHGGPVKFELGVPEQYAVLILYVWQTSRQTSAIVEISMGDSHDVTCLPCPSVALFKPDGGALTIRLSEAVNDCRLLIVGGQRIPNVEAVIASHRNTQRNLISTNDSADDAPGRSRETTKAGNLCFCPE